MDLVIRNVRLRGMPDPHDIGIVGEEITRLKPHIAEAGAEEIDGDGGLAIPSFADSHSHLDKSMMIYQSPPAVTGTITESLARSYVAKQASSVADVVARGRQALQWAVANGTGAIRVHSDVDHAWGTTGVEGLLELKQMFAGVVDLQIVVLPAANPLNDELRALVRRGMDLGADAIGGSPHLEHSPPDVVRYVDFVFHIAKHYDVDIDLHIDQNVESTSDTRAAEVVLVKTLDRELRGPGDAQPLGRVVRLLRDGGRKGDRAGDGGRDQLLRLPEGRAHHQRHGSVTDQATRGRRNQLRLRPQQQRRHVLALRADGHARSRPIRHPRRGVQHDDRRRDGHGHGNRQPGPHHGPGALRDRRGQPGEPQRPVRPQRLRGLPPRTPTVATSSATAASSPRRPPRPSSTSTWRAPEPSPARNRRGGSRSGPVRAGHGVVWGACSLRWRSLRRHGDRRDRTCCPTGSCRKSSRWRSSSAISTR